MEAGEVAHAQQSGKSLIKHEWFLFAKRHIFQ
jgi:hypothetical protein